MRTLDLECLKLSGCGATPQLRGGSAWSCRRVLLIARARDWRLGLGGGGEGKCLDLWFPKLGASPTSARPWLCPVASDLYPVWGVEPPGTPSRSWGLVWGGGGRARVRGHRCLRSVCSPTWDQRLTSSRDGDLALTPAEVGARWAERAKAERSRRRRRGNKSGGVNLRARSLHPGSSGRGGRRLGLRCGGPALRFSLPWRDSPPPELPVGPVTPAGQDRRGRRWARECSPSCLSPSQATSPRSGAGARGAAQPRNFLPREKPASTLLLRACTRPLTTLVGVFQVG